MIAEIADRFPGSEGSRAARGEILALLRGLGLEAGEQWFRVWPHAVVGQTSMGRMQWAFLTTLVVKIIAYAILMLTAYVTAHAGAAMLLLLPLLLVEWWLFRPIRGCNVWADIAPKSDARHTVTLIAHYDAPRLHGLEFPAAVFVGAVQRVCGGRSDIGHRFASSAPLRLVLISLGLFVMGTLSALLVFAVSQRWELQAIALVVWLWLLDAALRPWPVFATQMGANDNGTGVAALQRVVTALREEPLDDTAVQVVFTDAEELGGQGMHAWVTECGGISDAYLAVDAVGEGELKAHITKEPGLLALLAQQMPLANGSGKADNGDLRAIDSSAKGAIMAATSHAGPHGHWDDGFSPERWQSWEPNIDAAAMAILGWLRDIDTIGD